MRRKKRTRRRMKMKESTSNTRRVLRSTVLIESKVNLRSQQIHCLSLSPQLTSGN